ncbi:hypothetical protein [Pengzhenrongella phosphoraccumulans]|uniref:hypothetical protein n=1 Tax=Pengzhenrongella phosphoraccumulans TaxID=3114394 RepID=UPI003890418A
MATIVSPGMPQPHVHAHHDRLRAAAPVLAASAVLLAVLLGGALLAGSLVDLGMTLMTSS